MKKLLIILAIVLAPFSVLAHEGHDNAPGSYRSLHGGTVQPGKQLNLEVIVSGKEVTIFPISHDGKDIRSTDVKVEAIAKPKKGKPYSTIFTPVKSGLLTTIDLKGSNRIPIEISITMQGKTDHFVVQVEE